YRSGRSRRNCVWRKVDDVATARRARGECSEQNGKVACACTKGIFMALSKGEGIITIASNHSVDGTVDKLKGILQAKGVNLFALVDHSGEAEKVGMKMPPTKLLIFGSPRGGTPVMLAAPSIAIDLPLKILVAEDSQ